MGLDDFLRKITGTDLLYFMHFEVNFKQSHGLKNTFLVFSIKFLW